MPRQWELITFITHLIPKLEKLEGYFDIIINTVSTAFNLNQYLNLLRLDGTMVVVGAPEKDAQISAHSLIAAWLNCHLRQ